MAKAPAFQFFPGDWLRDDISGCSLEAQGLWLRMMMIMHDSQIYGQLILNGQPMSSEFLAKKIGISPKKYLNLIKELEFAGVVKRKENGVIYSGRMERDEHERELNRERQRRHYESSSGKPNAKPNGNLTDNSSGSNAKPNATSSSSSSTSIKEEELREATALPSAPADVRKDHPAIKAVHSVVELYPPKEIWDELIERLGLDVDLPLLKKCFTAWRVRGYNKTNYDWTEWYHEGIPKAGKSNGTNRNFNDNKQTPGEIIANRPYRKGNTD